VGTLNLQMPVSYEWRGQFADGELNGLHANAFGTRPANRRWRAMVGRQSLGWVVARDERRLVGFVNVAWDGFAHAFVTDTMVLADARRTGIGTTMLALVRTECEKAGCEWLHVDFEDNLGPFYLESCGFTATAAGLIKLTTQ
jgi:GNAT superfamily N-acetyltransferase